MERESRGSSIIALPDNYVCIDIETTGLSFEYDEIIEVSALKVCDQKIVDLYTTLIKPTFPVPGYITALTGITNEMVSSAPQIEEILPVLYSFIGSSIVVGHNVSFDVNFLYDSFCRVGMTFSNDFIDTMRIARKLYPEMQHHRLVDLIEKLKVPRDRAHRSEDDAKATILCFESMKSEILSSIGQDAFIAKFRRHNKPRNILSDLLVPPEEVDDTNPIYGRSVCFTGALSRMQRKEALQIVVNFGGIPMDSVTKKTNFLVVGNEEFATTVKDGKTSKMKKAEELELKGCDIVTISEDTFFDLLK